MKTSLSLIITIVFFISSLQVFAQRKSDKKDEGVKQESIYEVNRAVYLSALKYKDFDAARQALYQMIALQPENKGLKDTLVFLYYNTGDYVQTLLIGMEILKDNPENQTIIEIVAISQQSLGLHKEALENFEKLYQLSGNQYFLYNVASTQYRLKRYGECTTSLNQIISGEETDIKVNIANGDGKSQSVPLKAAAYNMVGVMALDLNQPDLAKKSFTKAVELHPEFMLAKGNLQRLETPTEK